MNYTHNIVKGIFLLILAISNNFLSGTLGCKTQKLLNNTIAKHVVLLFIIYFAIDFTSTGVKYPPETLRTTIIIYVFYILFTRMNIYFTMISFALLAAIYVSNNYIEYYTKIVSQDRTKQFTKMRDLLVGGLIIIVTTGFISYFVKQRRDHSVDWSLTNFIFGTNKCDTLK